MYSVTEVLSFRKFNKNTIMNVEISKKQKNKRRYNLHYIVRKKGFKVNTKEKAIYIFHEDAGISDKHIQYLVNEFGYGKQLEMYKDK